MGTPVRTWKLVADLTDPLDVEDNPVTFRSFDAVAMEPHLRGFRSATIESAGRTGLRIRAEIDAPSPREAIEQVWQVIERVFYPDSVPRVFGSVKVRMSVTPATAPTR